eukprot:GHVT01021148.1.p1 GENE.GHVT01021148.1~~GHVT01021148.1.p1  ORF type:complete len:619 (-),score=48.66 GHVT01021148.1:978-2834(-)
MASRVGCEERYQRTSKQSYYSAAFSANAEDPERAYRAASADYEAASLSQSFSSTRGSHMLSQRMQSEKLYREVTMPVEHRRRGPKTTHSLAVMPTVQRHTVLAHGSGYTQPGQLREHLVSAGGRSTIQNLVKSRGNAGFELPAGDSHSASLRARRVGGVSDACYGSNIPNRSCTADGALSLRNSSYRVTTREAKQRYQESDGITVATDDARVIMKQMMEELSINGQSRQAYGPTFANTVSCHTVRQSSMAASSSKVGVTGSTSVNRQQTDFLHQVHDQLQHEARQNSTVAFDDMKVSEASRRGSTAAHQVESTKKVASCPTESVGSTSSLSTCCPPAGYGTSIHSEAETAPGSSKGYGHRAVVADQLKGPPTDDLSHCPMAFVSRQKAAILLAHTLEFHRRKVSTMSPCPSTRSSTRCGAQAEECQTPEDEATERPQVVVRETAVEAWRRGEVLTPFHSQVEPSLSIAEYFICCLINFAGTANDIGVTMVLLRRLLKTSGLTFSPLTAHRILLAVACLTDKLHNDRPVPARLWAQMGGISRTELHTLEEHTLKTVDWKIKVDPEEFMEVCGRINRLDVSLFTLQEHGSCPPVRLCRSLAAPPVVPTPSTRRPPRRVKA